MDDPGVSGGRGSSAGQVGLGSSKLNKLQSRKAGYPIRYSLSLRMKIGIDAFDGDKATTIDEVSGRVGAEALPVGSFSRPIPSVGLQCMVLGNRYGRWADSAYAKTFRIA